MVEYKAISAYTNSESENTNRLNHYAKSGWRLVGVLPKGSGSGQFILEREVEDA